MITPRFAAFAAFIAGIFLSVTVGTAHAQSPDITGTGATFPAKVYLEWTTDYARQTGQAVSYKPAGSSAGVKGITERAVDFGASDVPLSPHELDKRGLFQFPTLVGGIVPFVNLPGVKAGALRLDAATLAKIWAGEITRWNAPGIKTLNPGLELPSLPILRVVRSDGSGTTTVFVQYLREAAPAEAAQIEPEGGRAKWPGKTLAEEGSAKLVAAVKATPGAIGYASSDYTLREGLSGIRLRNRRGEFVEPTLDNFKAAIVTGGLFRNGLEPRSLVNLDGVSVWPIVTATYVLVPREPQSIERASRTLHFFYWSFLMGDRAVAGTGFAPLPISTQARIVALLSNFKTPAGKSIPVMGGFGAPARTLARQSDR
ncbi:MAG: phosphate ABC transporter substrate-binding protein PstS [Pseudomonadota bacterium]